jgi:hypothetical protein
MTFKRRECLQITKQQLLFGWPVVIEFVIIYGLTESVGGG